MMMCGAERLRAAKEGDNTTARPGLFELAGKAKWSVHLTS